MSVMLSLLSQHFIKLSLILCFWIKVLYVAYYKVFKFLSFSRFRVGLNIMKAYMESLYLLICIILLWLTNKTVYNIRMKTGYLPLYLNQNRLYMQLVLSWSFPLYSTNKISNLWPTFDFMLKGSIYSFQIFS